jgi:DNA modification methylase
MIERGDIIEWCKSYTGGKFHAVLCDPPYELSFMQKAWDGTGISFNLATWKAIAQHLYPGAYLLAFGGTRTFHRIAVAIEDAGFEIRDTVMWVYGSGFPKSHNVGKAVDKAEGNEREVVRPKKEPLRQGGSVNWDMRSSSSSRELTRGSTDWEGYGTALKPSWEPVIIARLPLEGTVAQNTQKYGSGALNIDRCRVQHDEPAKTTTRTGRESASVMSDETVGFDNTKNVMASADQKGRWPANLIHDGSDEVVGMFPGEEEKSAARFFMSCASQPSDSIMSVCPNTPASSVLAFLITIPATAGSSAPTSAEVLRCEPLVQNVKSVGVQCEKCATSIAHELVRIKTLSSGKDLRATLASMPDYANSTPHQNLVSIVEEWQSTDTIPTTENLLRLFGSALPATDAPTRQESPDFANAPVRATRFLYSPKVSKRERDAGLEHLEVKRRETRTETGAGSWEEKGPQPARNNHPTLKPISLTTYLAKLILPPKLDKPRRLLVPFAGSGSEVIGGYLAGWDEVLGVERESEYVKIAEARINHWTKSSPQPSSSSTSVQPESTDGQETFGI